MEKETKPLKKLLLKKTQEWIQENEKLEKNIYEKNDKSNT
jgi:hypothetical protein